MNEREREHQDAELNEGMEEKCNPGHCYRKRLEPVLPGRLDLRSRKDAITERRGKVQMKERKEGRERGNTGANRGLSCLRFLNVLLSLTLSSFVYTTTMLLQPAGPAATAAAQGSL